jgi:hypothetical protein
MSSPAREGGAARGPSDVLGYTIAAILFIGGGIAFTTPVLNWICGPALIVATVVAVGRIQDRLAARHRRSPE